MLWGWKPGFIRTRYKTVYISFLTAPHSKISNFVVPHISSKGFIGFTMNIVGGGNTQNRDLKIPYFYGNQILKLLSLPKKILMMILKTKKAELLRIKADDSERKKNETRKWGMTFSELTPPLILK